MRIKNYIGLFLLLFIVGCKTPQPNYTVKSLNLYTNPLVPGGTGGVGVDAYAMLYQGSPQCGEGTLALPPPREKSIAIQECIKVWFRGAIFGHTFIPGGQYTWPDDEVERVLSITPCIAWFDRPVYLQGWNGSDPNCQPCWLCAAGHTGYPCIGVSLKDQSRVLPLVAWETGNYYIMSFGRWDLIDGSTVSALTNACAR